MAGVKGRSGAPKGNRNAAKGAAIRCAIRRMLCHGGWAKLERGIERILDKAAAGDLQAIKFVAETLDGKPRRQG